MFLSDIEGPRWATMGVGLVLSVLEFLTYLHSIDCDETLSKCTLYL